MRLAGESFLELAGPLWQNLQSEGRHSPKDFNRVLHFSWIVWNAVVVDTLKDNDETVTKLKSVLQDVGDVPDLIDEPAARKKTIFGEDLRLSDHYELTQEDGGWRVSVQARGR